MIRYYFRAWFKLFNFSGRSSRQELLIFHIVNLIIIFLIFIFLPTDLWSIITTSYNAIVAAYISDLFSISNIFYLTIFIYLAYLIFPSLYVIAVFSLFVRRLHDINRNGVYNLLWVIPIIGWGLLIYMLLQKGTVGDNRYGKSPLRGNTKHSHFKIEKTDNLDFNDKINTKLNINQKDQSREEDKNYYY